MKPTDYAQAISRERSIAPFVPQCSHIAESVIVTRDGDLQRTWKVGGIPFETAEMIDVHVPKMQLNTLIRSIGSSNVAFWQHTVHRHTSVDLPAFSEGYAGEFNQRLGDKLNQGDAYTTDLYLTVIYRPAPSKAMRAIVRAGRRSTAEILEEQAQALKALEDISQDIESTLKRYQLDVLGLYTDHHGAVCSSALSFLNYLVCGQWQAIQAPTGPIHELLSDSQLFIGTDTIEIHAPDSSRFAKCIELKSYNATTQPGLFNELLYQPYEFVITQSFSVLDRNDALTTLQRQQRYLISTEDAGASQIADMSIALDELQSGAFCLGEYHMVITVYGESAKQAAVNTSAAMAVIKERGFIGCLSKVATDAAWYSQLPCNWFYRPRVAFTTSLNFASMAGMHNLPTGKRSGLPWGDCLTALRTPSGQPFYFSYHACPDDADYTGKPLVGHTMITGKSGVGKSVVVNTLLLQAQRYSNLCTVVFDIDGAAMQTIDTIGGKYFSIENGKPTGLNPFSMPATEDNCLFLEGLVIALVSDDGLSVSTSDRLRISEGIRTLMALPIGVRRLSTLLQSFTQGVTASERENSLVKRLAKWCDGGSLAWALDCGEPDVIDVTTHSNYGFDCTALLANDAVRTPVILYLLHRIKPMVYGPNKLIVQIDEGFKFLDNPVFKGFIGDALPTWRKHDALMVIATQSASTILDSSITAALREQLATAIYLPNPRAVESEYRALGCSVTEYDIVKSFTEDSRLMLIQQNGSSVIAQLDLSGLDDDLAILSNTQKVNT